MMALAADRVLIVGGDRFTPSHILCLGAHSDDIEIGCGGTLMTLLDRSSVRVSWVVFSASGDRADEARNSAMQLVGEDQLDLHLHDHRESYFPYQGQEIKERFDELGRTLRPDLVLVPHRDDAHQDHRLLAELAGNTFRDHLILEYEIPKYDGDLGRPSVYARLPADVAARKVDHLLRFFPSQTSRPWFTRETFNAVLRLRGIECGAPDGYAEAFHCRKLVLL
jgi:LmbE family N-acetylglucosaminyl deacetylase